MMSVDPSDDKKIKVNDVEMELDVLRTKTGFHILHEGKGVSVDVVAVDRGDHLADL